MLIANAIRFALSWLVGIPVALALSIPALVLWGMSYIVDAGLTHFTTKFSGGDVKKIKNPITEAIKGFFWKTAVSVWTEFGIYGPEVVAKSFNKGFYELLEMVKKTDKPTAYSYVTNSVGANEDAADNIVKKNFAILDKDENGKKGKELVEQIIFKEGLVIKEPEKLINLTKKVSNPVGKQVQDKNLETQV